jgi:hypothetical protein
MTAHRKSNRLHADPCEAGLRKRGWKAARSFFDSDRAAVLDVRARLVIGLMEQHIVELPLIDHFPAVLALVEVGFLHFAQLVKVSGIHSRERASAASPG